MDLNELAKSLFGKDKSQTSVSPGMTTTVYGTAMSDSENGEVQVFISDDAVGPDFGADPDATVITLPTSPSVKMGDTVAVTLLGGGAVKHPYVSAVIGSGDLTAKAAEMAQSAADAAEEVANRTQEHFWHAETGEEPGVHITEVPQEEWSDPDSENYHSGANQLSNSAGILLRDGLTNLSQFTPGAFAVYDGSGNGASNIVALLSSDTLSVGSGADYNFQVTGGSLKLAAGSSSLFAVTDNSGATTIDVGTAEFYGTAELNSLKALFNGSGFYVANASAGAKILNQNGFESGYSLSTYYNDGYFEIVDRFGHQVCSLYAELDYWPSAVVKFDTQVYLYPPEDPPEGPAVVNIGGTKITAEDGAINIKADTVSVRGGVTAGEDLNARGIKVSSTIRRDISTIDSTANPSARSDVHPINIYDANGILIGQLRVSNETDGRIGAGIIARQGTTAGGGIKQNRIMAYTDAAGNYTYSVTDPAAFRDALGASSGVWTSAMIPGLAASKITSGTLGKARGGTGKTTGLDWTSLGTTTNKGSVTIDLTAYSEICIAAKASSKLVSATLPKALLTTSSQEVWLGGGKSSGGTANSGNLRAVVNATTTKVTGVNFSEGSTDRTSSTTWYVYAR